MIAAAFRFNRNWSIALRDRYPNAFRSPHYKAELLDRIKRDLPRTKRVLEAGGIDRPLLRKGDGYEYVGLDIEHREGCEQIYDQFLVQSIEDAVPGQFDMAISITLLEHVPDNERSIKSMFDALKSGGVTHHYMPSKWHPYAVGLRMIGPKWQKKLIPLLRPNAVDDTGYPAFFDLCTAGAMRRQFEKAGFVDIDVKPYYRANDYFAAFFPA
jgi:SAM-dependent methyltransferase